MSEVARDAPPVAGFGRLAAPLVLTSDGATGSIKAWTFHLVVDNVSGLAYGYQKAI